MLCLQALVAHALASVWDSVEDYTGTCCGTSGPGSIGGQGDGTQGIKLFKADGKKLVAGQTWGVPSTVIGSEAELGSLVGNTNIQILRAAKKEYFTLTPADFMLDRTFNESQPLVRWGGGDNGGLFIGWQEETDSLQVNSVTSYIGDKGFFAKEDSGKFPALPGPSMMQFSASSTTFKKAYDFANNFFYIALPDVLPYVLEACASFGLTNSTAIPSPAPSCPQKRIKAGEYKFSMMGLLSGTHINLNSTSGIDTSKLGYQKDYVNITDWKSLHYRQILNLKNMRKFRLQISTDSGPKIIAAYNASMAANTVYDISSSVLSVLTDENSTEKYFNISLNPTFVSGTFERKMDDRLCSLTPRWETIDPQGAVLGESARTKCVSDQRNKTNATAAAPVFTPKEERPIKVTIRATQCLDRKDWNLDWNCPRCEAYAKRLIFGKQYSCLKDANNQPYACSLPRESDVRVKDCPNWMTIGAGDNCCNNGSQSTSWAVGRDMECEPGSCFMIDYILPLEDEATGKRTAFGNPKNSPDGMSKGTYFVYNPEIVYNEPGPASKSTEVTVEVKMTVTGVTQAAIIGSLQVQKSFKEGMATTLGVAKEKVKLVQVGSQVLASGGAAASTSRNLAGSAGAILRVLQDAVELKFNIKAADAAAATSINLKTNEATFKDRVTQNTKTAATINGVGSAVQSMLTTSVSSSTISTTPGVTKKKKSNQDALIGGVVGGLVGGALLLALAYFCFTPQQFNNGPKAAGAPGSAAPVPSQGVEKSLE